jgi:hypothetical protein
MTNGLSITATGLRSESTEAELRDEYVRICRGIQRGLATGKVTARIGGGVGRPITDSEARWVFYRTSSITESSERYRVEVFLFCVVGFAKDRGGVAIGPARFLGAELIHAQLSSKMMESWPFCGSGGYRQWLDWAEDSGYTRITVNYRHSQDPARSRARTFELEAELDGLSGVSVNSEALLLAAQSAQQPGRASIHPRQVEHALYISREYGGATDDRYGTRDSKLIHRLVTAYQEAAAAPTRFVVPGAA